MCQIWVQIPAPSLKCSGLGELLVAYLYNDDNNMRSVQKVSAHVI